MPKVYQSLTKIRACRHKWAFTNKELRPICWDSSHVYYIPLNGVGMKHRQCLIVVKERSYWSQGCTVLVLKCVRQMGQMTSINIIKSASFFLTIFLYVYFKERHAKNEVPTSATCNVT